MHDDVYQMYLEEVKAIPVCTPEEETVLLAKVKQGDEQAKGRILEGSLQYIIELVKAYGDQGLPIGDLIQEANVALIMAVEQYEEGDFRELVKGQVELALKAVLEEQRMERKLEEELRARVNVLKDISQEMADELGREATVEELAAKMKMTVEEIKDIMKMTLDAISVSGAIEM